MTISNGTRDCQERGSAGKFNEIEEKMRLK